VLGWEDSLRCVPGEYLKATLGVFDSKAQHKLHQQVAAEVKHFADSFPLNLFLSHNVTASNSASQVVRRFFGQDLALVVDILDLVEFGGTISVEK